MHVNFPQFISSFHKFVFFTLVRCFCQCGWRTTPKTTHRWTQLCWTTLLHSTRTSSTSLMPGDRLCTRFRMSRTTSRPLQCSKQNEVNGVMCKLHESYCADHCGGQRSISNSFKSFEREKNGALLEIDNPESVCVCPSQAIPQELLKSSSSNLARWLPQTWECIPC